MAVREPAPPWDGRTELHISRPRPPLETLEGAIAPRAPPLFPVSIYQVPARISFHDLPDEVWRLGSAEVSAAPVSHPGPTVGYRIEEGGRSLVYIPDHEPYAGPELLSGGFRLARDASILIHDAQYLESEYPADIGGDTRASPTLSPSPAEPGRGGSCSSTTTRCTPTRPFRCSRRAAELWNGLRLPELARVRMRLTLGPGRDWLPTGKDRGVTTVRPEPAGSIIAGCSKTSITSG